MKSKPIREMPLTLLPLLAAMVFCGNASATTRTWATAGAGTWENGANWGGTAPQTGDDVVITNAGASVLLSGATPVLSSVTLSRTLVFTNWTTLLTASNVIVQSGGVVTLPPAFTDVQPSNRVWIVCTNLTVASGGAIGVNGKGYAGGPQNSSGYGPGKGLGGSYGGGVQRRRTSATLGCAPPLAGGFVDGGPGHGLSLGHEPAAFDGDTPLRADKQSWVR